MGSVLNVSGNYRPLTNGVLSEPTNEISLNKMPRMLRVACEVALLAPKLLLSGAGWVLGFLLFGNVGAGLGDAAGTFIGCFISALIEYAIGCFIGDQLEFRQFLKQKMAEAVVLATGSLAAGMVFNVALTKWAPKMTSNEIGQAFITGLITTAFFVGGNSAARTIYSHICVPVLKKFDENFRSNEKLELSVDNFWKDVKTGVIILFGETLFVATALPLGAAAAWLYGSKLSVLKGGASVAIGGSFGKLLLISAESFCAKESARQLDADIVQPLST